jgi:Helix-turn-helix domain
MMGMRRTRGARGAEAAALEGEPARRSPIPLDALSVIAGIAPGLELESTVSPDGSVPSAGTVSVDDVGHLLRCSEATVRRLIRTAVLRPVGVGERYVRRSDVESYRRSLHRRVPGKPGE